MTAPTTTLPSRFTIPPEILEAGKVKVYYPTEKHLKPEKLRKRLGNHFDAFWMSVEPPVDLVKIQTKQTVDLSLEQDVYTLNRTALETYVKARYAAPNSSASRDGEAESKTVNDAVNATVTWLMHKASCPVYYKWEDMGPLFWPRWVRKGLCSLKGVPLPSAVEVPEENFCSWPPGMHCVPAESERLVVLRWDCQANVFVNNSNNFRQAVFNNFNKFRQAGRTTQRAILAASKSDRRFRKKRAASVKHDQDKDMSSKEHAKHFIDRITLTINVTLNHFVDMARIVGWVIDQSERKTAEDGNATTGGESDSTIPGGTEAIPERFSSDKSSDTTKDTHSAEGFNSFSGKDAEELANIRRNREEVAKSRAVFRRTLRDIDNREYDSEEEEEEEEKEEDEKEERDDSDNGTEDWDKQLWKGNKRKQETKCSWKKLPIPVTTDCYCSC